MTSPAIRLTQYSHGAGCGCKISPKVLDKILHSEQQKFLDPRLLVGNETRDDAAVYDIGNGVGIISTTDFFMPIVDDPFDFGRIAATNAISDVYAMGGKPIMAIAILGWPIDKLAPEVARQVIEGGRYVCQQAGISLAGGIPLTRRNRFSVWLSRVLSALSRLRKTVQLKRAANCFSPNRWELVSSLPRRRRVNYGQSTKVLLRKLCVN